MRSSLILLFVLNLGACNPYDDVLQVSPAPGAYNGQIPQAPLFGEVSVDPYLHGLKVVNISTPACGSGGYCIDSKVDLIASWEAQTSAPLIALYGPIPPLRGMVCLGVDNPKPWSPASETPPFPNCSTFFDIKVGAQNGTVGVPSIGRQSVGCHTIVPMDLWVGRKPPAADLTMMRVVSTLTAIPEHPELPPC